MVCAPVCGQRDTHTVIVAVFLIPEILDTENRNSFTTCCKARLFFHRETGKLFWNSAEQQSILKDVSSGKPREGRLSSETEKQFR
jgi:hypothetical protein